MRQTLEELIMDHATDLEYIVSVRVEEDGQYTYYWLDENLKTSRAPELAHRVTKALADRVVSAYTTYAESNGSSVTITALRHDSLGAKSLQGFGD